ncbi:MAG: hypothetical protein KAY59_04490, partial [Acidobacteria bacterium]|nr:hypothetical protein [Acidobacteriota bacterium]
MRRWIAGLNWKSRLDLLATVAMLAAAVALIWASFRSAQPQPKRAQIAPPVPAEEIDVSAYPSLGSASAPVTVIEFSDLLCP